MSTRGCIARINGKSPDRFVGRYHHWDSYPAGLGKGLFDLYKNKFNKNINGMLKHLLEDHRAGWSSIVSEREECYCHTVRQSKEDFELNESNASGCGVEYAYVFDGEVMYIMASVNPDGTKMVGAFGMGEKTATWKQLAKIYLNESEPNWKKIDE